MVDTRDLDESTLVEVDAPGRLVSITVEHARERTDLPAFMFKTYPQAVA